MIVLVWLAAFGTWPFFRPPHDGSTVLSVLDLGVHFTAAIAIGMVLAMRDAR